MIARNGLRSIWTNRFSRYNPPAILKVLFNDEATSPLHSEIWGLVPYLDEAEERRKEKIEQLSLQEQKELGVASFSPTTAKRRKLDFELSEDGVIELFVKFNRKDYSNDRTPKSVLLEHSRRLRVRSPAYDTVSHVTVM